MGRRIFLALRAILAGWAALLLLAYALEWLLRRAAEPVGAEWLATVQLALDCCVLAAAGFAAGRSYRRRAVWAGAAFAATLAFHDFEPLLPVNIPWLAHLAIDTLRDDRYAESLLTSAANQAFLFGCLAAGAWLARPPAGMASLNSLSGFMHPIDMKLAIEGMHCDACVRRVQNAIVSVEGAQAQQVQVGSATVSVDPKREELVMDAVRKAGYPAHKVE